MQKVKKAAAQLDSRAAISVLNNLKNNQIVVENYNIFVSFTKKQLSARIVVSRRSSLMAHLL